MQEVAPRPVGTVAREPILLAELRLVLVVADNIAELAATVGKLTLKRRKKESVKIEAKLLIDVKENVVNKKPKKIIIKTDHVMIEAKTDALKIIVKVETKIKKDE